MTFFDVMGNRCCQHEKEYHRAHSPGRQRGSSFYNI